MKRNASPKEGKTLTETYYEMRAEKRSKHYGGRDKLPSTENPPERDLAEEYLRHFQPSAPPYVKRDTNYIKRLTRFEPDIHFKTYTKRGG